MAIAVVACRGQIGLHAPPVQVEVSLAAGLPAFNVVGLAATVVKESKERVRAALLHSGFEFPAGRLTVNLSPAEMPKRSGRYDLPIALGILVVSGQLPARVLAGRPVEFYGELGLDGELKAVPGLLLACAEGLRAGCEVVLPAASTAEVAPLLRAQAPAVIRTASHLGALCAHLLGRAMLPPLVAGEAPLPADAAGASPPDIRDVRGQLVAKRALLIAAAGSHSLLMMGPPGAGKSMLAARLAGLLPPLTDAEALEVAAIASASGVPQAFGVRPMRAPHHTSSAIALIGGGANARPGEISLAHHGVLFLDEVLEYDRRALEALREPLESGAVTVSRAALRATYPAQFQLVAAMNPCPCGRLGDARAHCRCTPAEVRRYRARLSAPLLERLEIHLEVPRVGPGALAASAQEAPGSAELAARARGARERQLLRQGICNSRLSDAGVQRLCIPDPQASQVLARAQDQWGLSARAIVKILKVARTIADLENSAALAAIHVSEALSYRFLDRNVKGQSDSRKAI